MTNITAEEKLQKELLPVAKELIAGTKFNFVKFNNTFEYLNRKVTFRKVDINTAQVTIEGEGNDNTPMEVMVPEALQFMIDEIKAGRIEEVIDYRKYINELVKAEANHIKLTQGFNYNGREYSVTSITMPKDVRNGALVEYTARGNGTRTDYVSGMDEGLLSEIVGVLKQNKFL